VGAVFALFKSPGYKGLIPPYVVLTRPQGRFSEEGFLGPKYKPFATGGDPSNLRFEVEGVVARGITDERQQARRKDTVIVGNEDVFGHFDLPPLRSFCRFWNVSKVKIAIKLAIMM
jgi:hypothetical protein